MLKHAVEIILASGSPRRRELFSYFGLPFDVIVPAGCKEKDFAENLGQAESVVLENARVKAESVIGNLKRNTLLISADTVVFCGRIFGKPSDLSQAKEFLYFLSRNPHWVLTGVYMVYRDKVRCGVEKTKVFMDALSNEDIDEYLRREDVLDKAGGFGIQGFAGSFINRIEGCFYNVMGFPLSLVRKMMKDILED